jgi:hypothetical protein
MEEREDIMTWLWILLAAPFVGFVAYHFIVGFVQGFKEGWQHQRWRKLKGAWRLCQMANPDDDS